MGILDSNLNPPKRSGLTNPAVVNRQGTKVTGTEHKIPNKRDVFRRKLRKDIF